MDLNIFKALNNFQCYSGKVYSITLKIIRVINLNNDHELFNWIKTTSTLDAFVSLTKFSISY